MKTQVIIPTAGLGKRLESNIPKPLVMLNGKPIFIYTLEVFEQCSLIESVILVGHKEYLSEFEKNIKHYQLNKISKIVVGGSTRAESVYNGLNVVDKDTEIVLIHDGVRPLVTNTLIEESIVCCETCEAVVVAVPIKPTIKSVDHERLVVKGTLDRNNIWEIQTPQVFKKDILLNAYQRGKGSNPTDDASLVEKLGIEVKVVKGSYRNIKVTTKEDLTIARAFLAESNA